MYQDIKIYHIKYEKKIDIITDLNIKYDNSLNQRNIANNLSNIYW